MVRKERVDVKREFAAFAAKVEHLESLKKQLNALDTKGFEAEARVIRSQLNDINAGKKAERALNELRTKLAHHVSGRGMHSADHAKLKALSRSLEHTTHALKAKITHLEVMIKKKRRISLKKQLNPQEVASVQEIPQLERDLAGLHRQLSSHLHSKHVKIDSGVGVLVDTRFDDFIGDIKSELTSRLKEKEFALDERLKEDLKAREGLFAHRYKALVEEFHKRYADKVHHDLKKEVRAHFEKQLQTRLAVERQKIVDSLVHANVKRLHAERAKLAEAFERNYREKEASLEHHVASQLRRKSAELEAQLVPQKRLIERKIAAIHVRASRLERLRKHSLGELAKKKTLFQHHVQKQENALHARLSSSERERRELETLKKNQLALLASKRQALKGLRIERSHESHLIELRRKSLGELAKKKIALNQHFQKAERALRARASLFGKERRELETLKKKQITLLKAKHRELNSLSNQHARMTHERRQLIEHLDRLALQQKKDFQTHKRQLEHHYNQRSNENDAELVRKVAELKKTMHTALVRRNENLEREHAHKLNQDIRKKESQLRAEFKQNYQRALTRALDNQKSELDRKKALLEKHVLEQVKKSLG